MTKNRFFYHDKSYKQKWQSQETNNEFEETEFGAFIKQRHPFGFDSTLIFVDHCDFDSPEKVEAVFYGTSNKNSEFYGKKGIVGTGLTATKTVFTDASDSENLGMENKQYEQLIRRLSGDGIEITPHSLRPKTSFKNNDKFLSADLKIMHQFKSSTWVDHGYVLHNINRFGWHKASPHYILEKLLREGYKYYWSRIDYSLNAPSGNLNMLNSHGRAGVDYLKKTLWLIKNKYSLQKIVFSFLWDFCGNLVGWEAKDDLLFSVNILQRTFKKIAGRKNSKIFEQTSGPLTRTLIRLINPFFYFKIVYHFFFPDVVNSQEKGFYKVVLDGKEVWFFNSLWINDCVNCYAPKNIDKLIKENGLHIGHNYFCVEVNHYLSSTIFKSKRDYYIDPNFQKNLDYLSECQKQRKINVTSISSYGNFYSLWLKIKLKKITENTILINYFGEKEVKGFTILKRNVSARPKVNIFPQKKYQTRRSGNNLILWLDLNPREELSLEII